MRFGAQTVNFITITEDLNNRDSHNNPVPVETPTPVSGCRFRPLKAEEKIDLGTDKVKDPWKCTAPPVAAAMGAKPGDLVSVDGVKYQIVGLPRVFPGALSNQPFKVTIICEAQYG